MRKFCGFTLIELLVVLVLVTVLIGFAVPTYRSLVASNRVLTQVNQVITAVNFARSEAVRRHMVVTVCPSANGQNCAGKWRDGWIVFTDQKATGKFAPGDQLLRVYSAIPVKDQLEWRGSRSSGYLQLSPTGGTHGQQGTFIYCASASKIPQVIIISQTGRIRTATGQDASGQPLECN